MAKKGIVGDTVRTAVGAAQRAIAPTPLAKHMIAAAASQAVDVAEKRAKKALPSVERALKRVIQEHIVKPVDTLLGPGEPERGPAKPKRSKSAGRKAGRRKTAARKSATPRKKTAKRPARSRLVQARKAPTRKPSRKHGRTTAKRR